MILGENCSKKLNPKSFTLSRSYNDGNDNISDFEVIEQQGKYDKIPFTIVKRLLFERGNSRVFKYKMKFFDDQKLTRRAHSNLHFEVPDPAVVKPVIGLSQAKKMTLEEC